MSVICPKACGQCCRVIILKPRMQLSGRSESKWLTKHLTKISRKEAIKLNPNISHLGRHSYYKCDYFDYTNNLCKGYNDRLPICTNYPFYENVVLNSYSFIHTPDCYFINQVMCLG